MRFEESHYPLPLDVVKIGGIMYIRENITIDSYGKKKDLYRGDPVRVIKIIPHKAADEFEADPKVVSSVGYHFIVQRLQDPKEYTYGVYRRELIPTDPVVTVMDQRDYMFKTGAKNLTARFGGVEV